MADFVDLSSDYADKIVEEALQSLPTSPQHQRGHCLYCDEEVEGVFCPPEETDCREMWERDERMKRIRGR